MITLTKVPEIHLDADQEGHFHVILDKQYTYILSQLTSRPSSREKFELLQDLDDREHLLKRLKSGTLERQDLETLELIEQELEEVYGP